jgi:hypothetical protein
MKADEKVAERLAQLIDLGSSVLSTRRSPPPNFIGFDSSVNSETAYQWFTSAQNLLARVFGTNSEHYKNFTAQGEKSLTYSPVVRAQGVLKAARDDLEHGYLFDLRKVVAAEVFDDFLDQAGALVGAGYHQPAAVVAGCVLEDGLRNLCAGAKVAFLPKPKLDTMNAELAKAGVYNKLTQKRITAIADLRNNAAHGKWDQFTQRDVEDAIRWIREFMEAHFA